MGIPMDYGAYAATYSWARSAVPWILEPLKERARTTGLGARVLEVGCGTGNYLEAIASAVSRRRYFGFDRSREMIAQALKRDGRAAYAVADADRAFPFEPAAFGLVLVVDVLHHLANYTTFFAEVARVLESGGELVAVTDSEENMRSRSLTRFFPETLEIELQRYPRFQDLDRHAGAAGLACVEISLAEGFIELDDAFVAKLEAKCSSAIRLLSDAAHRLGIERVREASQRGERWLSSYSVLRYART